MLWYIIESEIWTVEEIEKVCLDENDDKATSFEAKSIKECARKCDGITKLFAYGTNDFGGQGCENGICKCHCVIIKDNLDESCKEIDENTYWFFKYKPGVTFSNDGKIHWIVFYD